MRRVDYFELALLLAHAQSQRFDERGKRWAAFIDNLHRICDEFARALDGRRRAARREKVALTSSV